MLFWSRSINLSAILWKELNSLDSIWFEVTLPKKKGYSVVYRFGISAFEANDDVRSKPGTKITKAFSLAISES